MRDDAAMRTTLDLDDDVLQAAKELAAVRGATAGQIVSELLRKALAPARPARMRNGVPLLPPLPSAAGPVTQAIVNRLRDE
jgi:hypothetical protein